MIKPTIGRVVLFKLNSGQANPFPALVCAVHNDKCINIAGFDSNGNAFKYTSVPLLQDNDPIPQSGFYAEWMPYQKEQAAKADSTSDKSIEQEIQGKGLTAPRITPADIVATIASEQYFIFPGTTLTICCLILQNGFQVTGESACASPANFDEELGRKIAKENAKQKIWALEGYLLKSKLAELPL
jgi:hypothetical protein